MSQITLEGFIIIPEDDLAIVKAALPTHIDLTRNEPGCIAFNVEQSQENKLKFNVYEIFNSQDAFDQHQIRVKQSHWGRVTQDVQRHYDLRSV